MVAWIKNNWLTCLLCAGLVLAILGCLSFGLGFFKAQSLADKLARDIRNSVDLVGKLNGDITGLENANRKLLADYQILERNNIELTNSVETIRGNLKEAIGILGATSSK